MSHNAIVDHLKTCRGAPYMLRRLPSRPCEAPQNTSPLKDPPPPLHNNQPPSRVPSATPLPSHKNRVGVHQ